MDTAILTPGLHLKMIWPIQTVHPVNTQEVRAFSVGLAEGKYSVEEIKQAQSSWVGNLFQQGSTPPEIKAVLWNEEIHRRQPRVGLDRGPRQ